MLIDESRVGFGDAVSAAAEGRRSARRCGDAWPAVLPGARRRRDRTIGATLMSDSRPPRDPQTQQREQLPGFDAAVAAAAEAWLEPQSRAVFDYESFRRTYPHAAIERAISAAYGPLVEALTTQLRDVIEKERNDWAAAVSQYEGSDAVASHAAAATDALERVERAFLAAGLATPKETPNA